MLLFISPPMFIMSTFLSVSPSVVEQCICYRLQADDMVLEWVAYSSTKNGVKLKMHNLEQFEHDVTTIALFIYMCVCVVFVSVLLDTNYSFFSGVKKEE